MIKKTEMLGENPVTILYAAHKQFGYVKFVTNKFKIQEIIFH
jgi:hypothetical protein